MANDMVNDNRFKVIGKAKQHLLEATNIETSPDEMAVLDSFLFRCWQMGWLKQYDTEPVEHGRWIRWAGSDTKYCSVCGAYEDLALDYCPNCGARMDGDDND